MTEDSHANETVAQRRAKESEPEPLLQTDACLLVALADCDHMLAQEQEAGKRQTDTQRWLHCPSSSSTHSYQAAA